MAVSAGQHQRPPEIQMVEAALNGASDPQLDAYIDALERRNAPGISWVNGALVPLLASLDDARWTPDQQRAAQVLAARSWFGIGGPSQWTSPGGPAKDYQFETADVLIAIAKYRRGPGRPKVSIEIACDPGNDIALRGPDQENLFTIAVPYSRATLAQMDGERSGLGPAGTDMDLASLFTGGGGVRTARSQPPTQRIWWDEGDPTRILGDVQGNILAGHGRRAVQLSFLRFDDATQAKEWLATTGPTITSALQQANAAGLAEFPVDAVPPPEHLVGLYLSHGGLGLLAAPECIDHAEPHFDGLRAPYERLGLAEPPSVTGHADGATGAHAVLLVASDDPNAAFERAQQLIQGAPGASQIGSVAGRALDGDVEPFGFRDGISNPALMLTSAVHALGGIPTARWSPVFPIENVLAPVTVNGRPSAASYLAYCKFEQNVTGFRETGHAAAEEARIGRTRAGTPLGAPVGVGGPFNDFDYTEPSYGSACPVGAHMRAVNPRDAVGRSWTFARRGMPYKDETSEGLLFMGFMGSIAAQYDAMLEHALAPQQGDALLTGADTSGRPFVNALDGGYFIALPKSFFAALRSQVPAPPAAASRQPSEVGA